eukprot:Rhum_TRINITY_DN2850_c0_g1::Rhum_TRINITY_DN2850_c0_g1_i1::g.8609::m.8609
MVGIFFFFGFLVGGEPLIGWFSLSVRRCAGLALLRPTLRRTLCCRSLGKRLLLQPPLLPLKTCDLQRLDAAGFVGLGATHLLALDRFLLQASPLRPRHRRPLLDAVLSAVLLLRLAHLVALCLVRLEGCAVALLRLVVEVQLALLHRRAHHLVLRRPRPHLLHHHQAPLQADRHALAHVGDKLQAGVTGKLRPVVLRRRRVPVHEATSDRKQLRSLVHKIGEQITHAVVGLRGRDVRLQGRVLPRPLRLGRQLLHELLDALLRLLVDALATLAPAVRRIRDDGVEELRRTFPPAALRQVEPHQVERLEAVLRAVRQNAAVLHVSKRPSVQV